MITAGICGYGGLGHVHANSLWKLDNVEVKAVCDIDPEKLAAGDVSFNIPQEAGEFDISTCGTYTEFDDMLAEECLDLMVIALPTDLHADYSIRAMAAGCHVFCEKPMALTVEDCERMIEARNRYGRQLMVGHCVRFWPEYKYLLQCIRDERFGKLHSLYMERLGYYHPETSWFRDHNRSGGGLLDLHIHDVDWVQMAFGQPDRISAGGMIGKTGGVDDVTSIWEYYGGPLVSMRGSLMYVNRFTMGYKALFEEATLEFNFAADPALTLIRVESETVEGVEVEKARGHFQEMRYFIECVEGKHDNLLCPAESSMESIDLASSERRIILGREGVNR